jgi:hypothetical protein
MPWRVTMSRDVRRALEVVRRAGHRFMKSSSAIRPPKSTAIV